MSDQYTKPLPDVRDPVNGPFWDGTRAHELRFQRCEACGAIRWAPGRICPECQTVGGTWEAVAPTGRLHTWVTYHRAFDTRFADDVPYTVGQILTDAGPMLYGLVLAEPDQLVLDAPVTAVFDEVTPDVTLVRWKPTG